jgi:hypothetical protein
MWQPSEEAEAFAQKSKEEWQREQEQRRLEKETAAKAADCQPVVGRRSSRVLLKAARPATLDKPDRDDLERRGFIAEQIEADGYGSVKQWQQVSGQFPSNLPGLLSDGRLNSQPGTFSLLKTLMG